ncbi:N5-glutamine methyltransferase family protein [Phreatobacter sp. AB_2022a]|uniref:N5-glutamine methyltransferase family protein n=1 Tax=Phreatobacter sp. AB_2022a TaxID=3003134 RepID=UPI002286D060|nr:HemK/PrmC family methyltransferase [Phreatobacter sp. AB_2022a]MCZ0737142.1 peptide chain release factor N(5)-glutamine methyltransferase [Phreatobacter sp. AB_2022a]
MRVTGSGEVAAAYACGHTRFMGLDLLVAPGALVPRPETELLGATAVDALHGMGLTAPRVIDMCCGTGNLACAIAARVRQARLWACDLTEECVAVARRNIAALGFADRAAAFQGDLFAPLSGEGLERTIDMVVCNPPYISEKRLMGERAHLLAHEPREAFAAGPYGLSIHMRVLKEALPYLRPGGALLFEVGLGQARQVAGLFARSGAYDAVSVIADAAGAGRVVLGFAQPS